MNFHYKAYLNDGRSDAGQFDAASRQEALRMLAARGLSVFELKESVALASLNQPDLRVSWLLLAGRRVDFSRLFADLALLTSAGLTVTQALRSMRSTEHAPAQQRAVIELLEKMSSGASAAASFAMIKAMPPEGLAMISIGESAGRLPDMFGALAAQYEERAKLRSQLLNALAYPVFLLVLLFAAVMVLTFALVPSIAPLFENSGQPAPLIVAALTGLRIGLTSGFATTTLALVALLLLLPFLPSVKPAASAVFQRLTLRTPLISKIIRKSAKARYLSNIALLVGNGAPMAKALELCALSTAIPAFKPLLIGVRDSVSTGEKLPSALKRCGLFDERIISLISVGDEANRLPAVTKRAAQILEDEAQAAIMRYTATLTPLMTVLMGLLIGGLVVSVMTALLSINEIAVQ